MWYMDLRIANDLCWISIKLHSTAGLRAARHVHDETSHTPRACQIWHALKSAKLADRPSRGGSVSSGPFWLVLLVVPRLKGIIYRSVVESW